MAAEKLTEKICFVCHDSSNEKKELGTIEM